MGLRWPWHPCWLLGRSRLFCWFRSSLDPVPWVLTSGPHVRLCSRSSRWCGGTRPGAASNLPCPLGWLGPWAGDRCRQPLLGCGCVFTRPAGSPQVIQPPPKPGALIRPPQVTLTQTPMVALRQPHNRIVLTTPQQIQLNQLQPGERLTLSAWSSSLWDSQLKLGYFTVPFSPHPGSMVFRGLDSLPSVILTPQKV